MVARRGNRPGKTHFGCLLTLLVLAGAAYFGYGYAEMYWRYYRIQDFVKTQVEFAPEIPDDVILRRLVSFSDTLGLNIGNRAWKVRRLNQPRQITIWTQYQDSVVISLFSWRKVLKESFRPFAQAAL